MTRLYVAGIAMRGSGYPNAEQTIRALKGSPHWQVDDHADWLPDDVHLWRISRGPLLTRLLLLTRLVAGNALALLRLAWAIRQQPGWVYVPYPAAFLLWWTSLVPRAWRPRMIADAYISLWDSAFRDRARGPGQGRGLVGRFAKAFEGRALRAAAVVLVDTLANRDLMVAEFGLDPARVRAVPLAIDVTPFVASKGAPSPTAGAPLRVLFVGTLIPLHGIGVLADVVRRAGPESGIAFHIVGDGQESYVMEALVADPQRAPVVWERGWLDLGGIAQRMAGADVCLGVFGGEGKAARVLPFKLYMALAAGKAIITQDRYSLPEGLPPLPVRTVPADPAALLAALVALQRDPSGRQALAADAEAYYRQWLGADALRAAWQTFSAGYDSQDRSN